MSDANGSKSDSQTNKGNNFFQGAREFNISTQYNIGEQKNIYPGNMGLFDILNPIPDASYSRNRKLSPPDSSCLPGTRETIIQRVASWADSSTLLNNSHVMWLYGYVGCGKSAIAQSVAEKYARKGRLAGSFFFFRAAGDRSRTGRLAATLASQVATAIPSTARIIEAAVRGDSSLLHPTTSLSTQLQRLVFDPIKASKWDRMGLNLVRGPFLIVIDGLDECADREEVTSFIEHMLDFFKLNPRIPLRILITSRVEEHIRTHLADNKVLLVNLVDHTSLEDIASALRLIFAQAAKHSRIIQAFRGGEWPAPEDLQQLVKHTGCSFIFMSTIAKFILDPSDDTLTPMDRLPLALNINPGLDGLYAQALSRAEHLPHFSAIISTITVVKEPLSIVEIADLLKIETFEVIRVLVNLHAILQVPGDDTTPVTMCHISLQDFLTKPTRSGRFCVDASPQHEEIVRLCMDVLAEHSSASQHPAYRYARDWIHFHLSRIQISAARAYDGIRLVLSHAKKLAPMHFRLIAATYALVDPETLPNEAELALTVNDMGRFPVDPWDDLTLYAQLCRSVPHLDTLGAIAYALKAVNDACDFNARHRVPLIWPELEPLRLNAYLPTYRPLVSYHYDIVLLGVTHLVRSNPHPEFGAIGAGDITCLADADDSRQSPLVFSWFFLSWAHHLSAALENDESIGWGDLTREHPVAKGTWTNIERKTSAIKRLLNFLTGQRGSPRKAQFIEGVKGAVELVKTKYPGKSLPKRRWGWVQRSDNDIMLFQLLKKRSKQVTILELLSGLEQLVECLEEKGCDHSHEQIWGLMRCPVLPFNWIGSSER